MLFQLAEYSIVLDWSPPAQTLREDVINEKAELAALLFDLIREISLRNY